MGQSIRRDLFHASYMEIPLLSYRLSWFPHFTSFMSFPYPIRFSSFSIFNIFVKRKGPTKGKFLQAHDSHDETLLVHSHLANFNVFCKVFSVSVRYNWAG